MPALKALSCENIGWLAKIYASGTPAAFFKSPHDAQEKALLTGAKHIQELWIGTSAGPKSVSMAPFWQLQAGSSSAGMYLGRTA